MKFKEFLQSIVKLNQLSISDSEEWIFYPGMLFGSCAKWWADWKTRYTAHEGLDIAFYKNLSGEIDKFDPAIMVPAIAEGTILNICDDFLGQSVVIGHERYNCTKQDYYVSHHNHFNHQSDGNCRENSIVAVVYSHICVNDGSIDIDKSLDKKFVSSRIKTGMTVAESQIIGKVADTSMRKSGILPHLHISFIEVSARIPFKELNWSLFADPSCDSVRFLNPLWL